MAALESQLRAQPEPEARAWTHFGDDLPKREDFRRRDVDPFLIEKIGGQTRAAKQCRHGYLLLREPKCPTFGDSETVRHCSGWERHVASSPQPCGFHFTAIGSRRDKVESWHECNSPKA